MSIEIKTPEDGMEICSQLPSYQLFVARLAKKLPTEQDDLMHAAIGVAGEAGELLDAVKKTWVYNKPLDRANVVEELGDLRFYMTALQCLLGISETEIIAGNITKLLKRYPDAVYTDAAAQMRMDKVEAQLNATAQPESANPPAALLP